MSRTLLMPRLAVTGIRKNRIVYLPYIIVMAVSVAIFFIFSCISQNPMMDNVPHAAYASVMLTIGKGLLGIILVPFLFYTNSFLIKQRKKELGLYTVLGLEKKHIGIMMIIESAIIYFLAMAGGILLSVVFGKLVFAFMMKMSSLPVDTKYTMDLQSFYITTVFFAVVSVLNLITNLYQVTLVNPAELLRASKKGEKEPKHLGIYSILGVMLLGTGYHMAITSKLDSMIFIDFFLAVILVVFGTYFLFTSGSVFILKTIRGSKSLYYRKENFICISGMMYRMKKNAASLVNICIFSTMVIITLLCTVSLRLGEEDAIRFYNPYDFGYSFTGSPDSAVSSFREGLLTSASEYGIRVEDVLEYPYGSMDVFWNGNSFAKDGDAGEWITVRILSLDEYNRMENREETLADGEIFIYSSQEDLGYQDVTLNGKKYEVKAEIDNLKIDPKETESLGRLHCYMVMKDMDTVREASGEYIYYSLNGNLVGEQENAECFLKDMNNRFNELPNHLERMDYYEYGAQMRAINGGLLFIGVFFGLLFFCFLVLVMYYKQISEGLEDKSSFDIMKKVGMSDADIRSTIRKQILMVFGFPAAGAVIHTLCSITMTIHLLRTLNLFNTVQIYQVTAGVIGVFLLLYGVSYMITARTYMKIVK